MKYQDVRCRERGYEFSFLMTVVGETLLGLRVGDTIADTIIARSKYERNSTSTYFLLSLAFKNGGKTRT